MFEFCLQLMSCRVLPSIPRNHIIICQSFGAVLDLENSIHVVMYIDIDAGLGVMIQYLFIFFIPSVLQVIAY